MKRVTLLLCGSFLLFIQSALASVSTDKLMAYWSGAVFGDQAEDVSVNTHWGSLVGGMSSSAGVIGNGFSFDGANGHIKVADSDAWDFSNQDFTISFWINPRAYTASYTRVMTQWQWNGGSNRAWQFYINSGRLTFAANGAFSIRTASQLATNQWHHITLTRTGSVARIYINGVVDVTNNSAGATLNNSSTFMLIGAVIDRNGVTAHPGDMLNGQMDEIRVYHRALTDTEIQVLADPTAQEPISWQPEPNTTSLFYPAATNCSMEDDVSTPVAHAYRGSYEVSQGKIMTCNLPVNPGKYIARIVFDHLANEMVSPQCKVGIINATRGSTATNTHLMMLSKDGGLVDVFVYEDLGIAEAYSNGHPHNTLVLTCEHGSFSADSWVRYGVIRVDYAVEQ
ncbi:MULTISPECIES: LamG domain-containing protein [Pseudoalteromonas]|uniref:LamG-like jellyroll fold domain-containing protein n=1 Tax=Pseudoalteromonas amylolytica TaxID=1859457 RepID=A0A1S1MMQ5_9GAMM|nr:MULTISPECIES: LamG domain-containing protein [Pseudoalteromonas]OHU86211.1 hypothetical protein BFC16_16030 [Pseudoalteromonas sp. JW3]OHU89683.1 hypothetical protein BET10_16290 [Pseudoalteromonas amylolytica]